MNIRTYIYFFAKYSNFTTLSVSFCFISLYISYWNNYQQISKQRYEITKYGFFQVHTQVCVPHSGGASAPSVKKKTPSPDATLLKPEVAEVD